MREKTIKLCLVTIGQSPRPDLWNEIEKSLNFFFEIYHFGLLDAPGSLDCLLADSREPEALVTQLRSGDIVRISFQKAHHALQNLIMEIRKWEKPDGIVVLCTGIREPADFPIPIFYPGALIRKTVMENPADPIGVILPDKRQWSFLDPDLKGRKAILFEINPPGDVEIFQEAADYLIDLGARMAVFHCMGYPLSAVAPFSTHFEEKTVHPRILIPRALNLRFGNI
jgi:SAM-dependent methyltransferase